MPRHEYGWLPGTTILALLLSMNNLAEQIMILAATVALSQYCPSRTVVIGPGIHLMGLLRELHCTYVSHGPTLGLSHAEWWKFAGALSRPLR